MKGSRVIRSGPWSGATPSNRRNFEFFDGDFIRLMLAYINPLGSRQSAKDMASFNGILMRFAPCAATTMSYIKNKKATFNYEVRDSIEAGIELFGHEAKSVRAGKGNLEGSYIIVRGGEAFLIGALINPYQQANTPESYDERRNRKLLLHKKEIEKIASLSKGETIIPISFYNKGRSIKLEVAIARGKKKHDKRQTISRRESDREINRVMKGKR